MEDICTKWGFSGQLNGLCNAYCEAMDCDEENPQASEQACTIVVGGISQQRTGLTLEQFQSCYALIEAVCAD